MKMNKKAVLLLSAAILLPTASFAQGGNIAKKGISSLEKQGKNFATEITQSTRNATGPIAEWTSVVSEETTANISNALSSANINAKEMALKNARMQPMAKLNAITNLKLLDAMRKNIEANPAMIFKEKFNLQLESLKKIGAPDIARQRLLSSTPNLKSKDIKRTIETFQNSFNETYEELAAIAGVEPQFLDMTALMGRSRREMILARGKDHNKWVALQNARNKGTVSWGFPGVDQINIQPAKQVLKQIHILNNSSELIKAISANTQRADQLMDLIFQSQLISRFAYSEQISLLKYISGSTELLGSDFFAAYVTINKQFPVMSTISLSQFSNYNTLEKYARNSLVQLIATKYSKAQMLDYSENIKFTICLSLLPAELQKTVAVALTNRELDAAIWLLKNPEPSQKRDAIQEYLKKTYMRGPTPFFTTFNFNSVVRPEIPTLSQYREAQQLRMELLSQRRQNLSTQITNLTTEVDLLSQSILRLKSANTFINDNAAQEREYLIKVRAEKDNKVTRMKNISKALQQEERDIIKDLEVTPHL